MACRFLGPPLFRTLAPKCVTVVNFVHPRLQPCLDRHWRPWIVPSTTIDTTLSSVAGSRGVRLGSARLGCAGLGCAGLGWAGLGCTALGWGAWQHGDRALGFDFQCFSLLIERYFSHFSLVFPFIFSPFPVHSVFSSFLHFSFFFFSFFHIFLVFFMFLWFFFLLPSFFFSLFFSLFILFHCFFFFFDYSFFLVCSPFYFSLFLTFSFSRHKMLPARRKICSKKDIQKILASRVAEEMRPEEVTEKSVAVQPAAKKTSI